ncbi:MAG: peptide-methionine (R)-S-oxide reductase MsrB [Actinomycetota bacterium]
MSYEVDDAELRSRLSAEQYAVTQQGGTERAFTGKYWDCHDDGVYRCIVCGDALFSSDTKYESGSGWPSFWEPLEQGAVERRVDRSHGMVRIEAVCASCGAHLGHVFPDGPQPTGERFCMNSASLDLDTVLDADEANEAPAEDS